MKISKISFTGYKEKIPPKEQLDPTIVKALDNARPYLRQIGNSMPFQRDLVISINDDSCDTIILAHDVNQKTQKSKLLAKGTEHTLTEHGLDFVNKVFEGLEKNNKKEFKEIASKFVKKLYRVQEEQHPIILETKYPYWN